jgi:drug/metabolite transporter (DMT)-like permease
VTPLWVAVRIFANPASNVFQKQLAQRGASPVFIIAAAHALLAPVCLPFLLATPPLPAAFWWNIALCALLAVTSNELLVFALRAADLSVLGPINAYKSVVSLLLGVFLIGEVPSAGGLAGVLLIVAGSYFVVDRAAAGESRRALVRGIQLRFGALLFSATEAVFLKRALLLSSPVTTFVFWAVLCLPVAAAAFAWLDPAPAAVELRRSRAYWTTYLWLALTTGLMQLATLLAFGKLQVGYSLALFQLSALVSVLLGRRYFAEGQFRRRLAGAAIMVAGATLIVLSEIRSA